MHVLNRIYVPVILPYDVVLFCCYCSGGGPSFKGTSVHL